MTSAEKQAAVLPHIQDVDDIRRQIARLVYRIEVDMDRLTQTKGLASDLGFTDELRRINKELDTFNDNLKAIAIS